MKILNNDLTKDKYQKQYFLEKKMEKIMTQKDIVNFANEKINFLLLPYNKKLSLSKPITIKDSSSSLYSNKQYTNSISEYKLTQNNEIYQLEIATKYDSEKIKNNTSQMVKIIDPNKEMNSTREKFWLNIISQEKKDTITFDNNTTWVLKIKTVTTTNLKGNEWYKTIKYIDIK